MGGLMKRAGKGAAAFVGAGGGAAAWAYLAVGLAVVFCYFLLSPGLLALNVTYDAIGASCVVAILAGVRRHRPARPAAWLLFCVGMALCVLGDGIWTVQAGFLGMQGTFPSAADAFYLSGYPFLAAGLLMFVRSRASGGDRAEFIDTAIVTVGGGVLVWVFLVAPYALDASLPILERLVSAAYPFVDVLLLAAAARLVFAPGGARPPGTCSSPASRPSWWRTSSLPRGP